MRTELRSDTFTKPTPDMMAAIFHARVGDDAFGEDPAVNELEAYTAALFGMEAALFCPTGTMTNQIGIKCHTVPGDEVICDITSHVYIFEGGGIAFNSGCQTRPIQGNSGKITASDVRANINPDDIHKPRTRLVCLENTVNRGGGGYYELSEIRAIKAVCAENDLRLHLDGARLFNALAASGETEKEYGEVFDSISICLSKGLGAPIGSLLLGDAKMIRQARRIRKVLGGGMRQAGFMAAAGLYALQHHKERLVIDHMHAKQIAGALIKKDFIGRVLPVETNIVIFEVKGDMNAKEFCDRLAEQDVYCLPVSENQVRMVTHLDVSSEMIARLTDIIDSM